MKAKLLRYLTPALVLLALVAVFVLPEWADQAVNDRGDEILFSVLIERQQALSDLNTLATELLEGSIAKADYDRMRAPYVSTIIKTEKYERLYDDLGIMSPGERANTYREIFDWGWFPP